MKLRQLEKKLIKYQTELINLMKLRIDILTKRQNIDSFQVYFRTQALILKIKKLKSEIKKKHKIKALKNQIKVTCKNRQSAD